MDAYLDFEFSYERRVSVLGIYRVGSRVEQLIGRAIHRQKILDLVSGIRRVITFNGHSCELPVLKRRWGIDLKSSHESLDLYQVLRKCGLPMRQKLAEIRYGISRLHRLRGQTAMNLWHWYEREGDSESLARLLDYNREDVMNLHALHQAMEKDSELKS